MFSLCCAIFLLCLYQCSAGQPTRTRQTLEEKVDLLADRMEGLQGLVDRLSEELTQIKKTTPRQVEDTAAFSAYMTIGTFNPSSAVPVPFDGTELNQGGHYNNNTYRFTCPVTGLYLFTVTLNSGAIDYSSDDRVEAEILVGGRHVAEVNGFTAISGNQLYLQPSNTVLLECTGGEEVYVRSGASSYIQIYGAETARRSTFSGALLTVTN